MINSKQFDDLEEETIVGSNISRFRDFRPSVDGKKTNLIMNMSCFEFDDDSNWPR